MSYAYLQGQEEQALAYFKSLLELVPTQEERERLEDLITKLEREIKDKRPQKTKGSSVAVQNLPCNLAAA